jgi:tetratricopeptide (TPR) repeat protein
MSEILSNVVPASPQNPLSTASDPFCSLTTELDEARNQFRARQFQEASAGLARLIAKAEGLLPSVSLTPEDAKRVNVALASALTLDGRCEEENGREQRAKDLWARAASIFDATLGKPTQSDEGWVAKFTKWVNLLAPDDNVKQSVPGDLLAYYGIALRMVGRRPEAISVLRQVTKMGSAAPETYRHLGLALKDDGEFSKAVEELDKALERGASDIRSWRGLAEAQESLGNKMAAAKACLGLAEALVAAGRMEDALTATGDSLRLNASDAAALRYRGNLLRELFRLEEALQTLDQAIALNPDDAVAWAVKGATLYAMSRRNDALDAFDQALKINPADAWTLAMKGEVLMRLKRFEEAELILRESVRLNPNSAPALGVLGSVLGALDKPEEALEQTDKALALEPDSVFALGVRGETLMRLQRFDDALIAYDKVTRMSSSSTYAWAGTAEALYRLGRVQESMHALDRVLEIDPKDAGALVNKARILCGMAEAARQSEGLDLFKKAIALHPSANDTAEIAAVFLSVGHIQDALEAAELAVQSEAAPASAFFTKAEALYQLNRSEEGLEVVEEGLRRIPEQEWGYGLGLKGQLLAALNRPADAEEALRESIRLNPTIDLTWSELGRLLNQSKRPLDALEAAEQALKLNSTDAQTLSVKAEALATLGRDPEAIACLQHVAELDASLGWVHEKLAELFEKQGQHELALKELDECIARDEKSVWAHAYRGFVLHSMGDRKGAEAALEKAVGLDGSLAWAYAELAAVRRELENPDGALTAINQALAMDPANTAAFEIKGQIFIAIGENEAALRMFNKVPEGSSALYFWKGLALDNLNRLQPARECYEKALKLEPEDIWSMRALGDIHLLQGEIETGRQLLEQILTRTINGPRGPFELGLCGWCHYGCGRLEPAIRLYSEALSLDRQGTLKSGQFDLALILACAKRYSVASREYERAADLAHQAHPWIQKYLFGVAIEDLKRAMEIRYPEFVSAPEVQACLARLKEEYEKVSADPHRPLLD